MDALFDFVCRRDDPLGVLTSTAAAAGAAELVRIEPTAVRAFARAHTRATAPMHEEDALHCSFLPPRQFCNYLLALEALNFCFWDAEPRWRVDYMGTSHDGYWALAAALHRAVRVDELPLWDAAFLAQLDSSQTAHMLRGKGRPPPLLDQRVANLREAGRVLQAAWKGQFANLVEASAMNGPALVRLIVDNFSSFRDEAEWRGSPVRFYKRAQICVADLARMAPGDGLGNIKGLGHLTAFADYKVPQVMRKEGMLTLAPELAGRIDRGEELTQGGEAEVQLRAATIWGCEWIARALAVDDWAVENRAEGTAPSAADVDYLLWSAGQHKRGLPPYHRTRTIYY